MLSTGLPVDRLINVDNFLAPTAVAQQTFQDLLIMGDSDVINTSDAIVSYGSLTEVAAKFGTTAPEYLAAVLFFGQKPQPNRLQIGRWARTATKGELDGGLLATADQLLSIWTAITNGGFHVTVDGGASTNFTGINLSSALNLNGVAALIQTAVRASGGAFAAVNVIWDTTRFIVKSGTTGATSSVSFMTAPTAGTDLSIPMKMTATLATKTVAGIAAETPLAGVTRVDGRGWYGLMFAASTMPTDSDRLAIAAYIEAATNKHIYGITSNASAVLDSAITTDIASLLLALGYYRTFVQYSASNLYAAASWFGRAFTVDFEGSNTAITMMWKQEPGIIGEVLTTQQADTLQAKRCNVFATYNNGASVTQYGVMSGPAYFDEIHGTDWLAGRIQTDLWNILYQLPKVAQTDKGVNVLVAGCEGGLSRAVTNGLLAPGQWNGPGFGKIATGDDLPKGWYLFADMVANQSQADREARKSPLIQIAAKFAGAIHTVDVLISYNR